MRKRFNNIFSDGLSTIIMFISLIFMIFILFISVKYNAVVETTFRENVVISFNEKNIYIIFILFFCLFITLGAKILKKINSKYFLIAIIIIFNIIGLYLVFNADVFLRPADQIKCIDIAKRINQGNYSDFKKMTYLSRYPFQLGWISFLRILLSFSQNITFFYFVNLIFTNIIIITIWLISKEGVESNLSQNTTALLSVVFLPHLFNILFIYGNIPGLAFALLSILLQLKLLSESNNKRKIIYILLSLLFMFISYTLKNNYQIFIIAQVILYMLVAIKKIDWKLMIIGIITLLIIPLNTVLLNAYYPQLDSKNVNLKSGQPKVAWVVMGLQKNNWSNNSGWYSNYATDLYVKENWNINRIKKQSKKDLKKQIIKMKNNPKETREFFINKYISTWADPMFQSVWNGPLPTLGGKMHTKIMQLIYSPNGNTILYKFIANISRGAVWLILILNIIYTILCIKRKDLLPYTIIALLYLVGGFMFHTIWETKSQYVWQYITCIIPLAGWGLDKINSKIDRTVNRYIKK